MSPDRFAPAAPAVLDRARAAIEPQLREVVGRLNADVRDAIGYHLGWWDADGTPIAGGGGKGIRPALAILSAEAVGAPTSVGVPGGVSVELVHDFSLIHDDVIDGDHERRHRPTVWALFGLGPAIIAGDALLTLALRVMLEAGPSGSTLGALALVDATEAMIRGQSADIASEARLETSIEECAAIAADKTGALMRFSASVGAILAGADPGAVAALGEYGHRLGLAFQAVDDLLGIWGHPEITGKPTWSDVRSRKMSLPIVYALAGATDAGDELRVLFRAPELSEDAIARAADLIEAAGGRAQAEEAAEHHHQEALTALESAPITDAAHAELVELARFVTARDY